MIPLLQSEPGPISDLGQFTGAIILLVGLLLIIGWVMAGKSEEEPPDDRDHKPPRP